MIIKWFKNLGKKNTDDSKSRNNTGATGAAVKAHPRSRGKHQKKRPAHENKPPWDIALFKVAEKEGETRFHDLGLHETVMHGICDLQYQYCTPVQAQVLPHALQGKDAIAKAQTGTGKTAAFLIAIINRQLEQPLQEPRKKGEPRALIIAPTRELVIQIAEDAKDLCKHTGQQVVALIGGQSYEKQHQKLQRQAIDIVVATPGRLIDFMTRKDIFLGKVETLVLDEADRMLDMGFIPQIKRIVRAIPTERQTLLFSATFDRDIINLAKQWTSSPIETEIEPEQVATAMVEQIVYMVSNEEKLRVLLNLLRQDVVTRALVFCNRRDQTQRLYEKVRKAGMQVGILSGEIAQNKRTRTLENFKNGTIKVLIATDVVGRGIHVDAISHVINYNLPEDPEDYVHRIGRTGRAGESGVAISLACENDAFQLPAIEELLGNKLNCSLPPLGLSD